MNWSKSGTASPRFAFNNDQLENATHQRSLINPGSLGEFDFRAGTNLQNKEVDY